MKIVSGAVNAEITFIGKKCPVVWNGAPKLVNVLEKSVGNSSKASAKKVSMLILPPSLVQIVKSRFLTIGVKLYICLTTTL